MKSVKDFSERKKTAKKISMVTAYDFPSAGIAERSDADCLLVGDSVAMVVHGFDSTVHATVEMMALHVRAVARGAREKFIVADLPFLSFRKGVVVALEAVDHLVKAGAHAVKLEGVRGHEDVIQSIVQSGVPVMGHLGLTPQSIHQLGGYRVQGKSQSDADRLLEDARTLDRLGCFAVVLECVPSSLARTVTSEVDAATIGIGAGPDVDGQVLVFHDLLGISFGFRPKFLRTYLDGGEAMVGAINRFHADVVAGRFPSDDESYS